jgi:hypothetical protein
MVYWFPFFTIKSFHFLTAQPQPTTVHLEVKGIGAKTKYFEVIFSSLKEAQSFFGKLSLYYLPEIIKRGIHNDNDFYAIDSVVSTMIKFHTTNNSISKCNEYLKSVVEPKLDETVAEPKHDEIVAGAFHQDANDNSLKSDLKSSTGSDTTQVSELETNCLGMLEYLKSVYEKYQ